MSMGPYELLEPIQSLSSFGLLGVLLWGIVENGILPLPVELFVIPFMVLTRSSPAVVALVGATGSILGGLLDYYAGAGGIQLFSRFSGRMMERAARSLRRYKRYGQKAIYVALFAGRLLPTSLKPVFVVAGSTRLNRFDFCVIVFVSSLIRYYVAATIGNVVLILLQ